MDNVTHSVTLAFAIISFVCAFLAYFFPARKYFKAKEHKCFFLLENKKLYILALGLLIISFILFDIQFYTNSANIDYITNILGSNVDALHYVLIYGGSVLLACAIYALVSIFINYFVFDLRAPKEKRKMFWLMIGIGAFTILSFVLFEEGSAPYLRYPLCNRIYFGSSGVKLVTVYTGYNWSPIPTGDSWGFSIAFYALCLLGGGLVVLAIDSYQLKIMYGEKGLLSTVFLIGFPTGIVGCRLWYVIGNWTRDGFDKDPWKILRIDDGGLAIMGASLAIVVCIIYLLIIKYKVKKPPYNHMDYLTVIDICVASILLAQCIGRWGNFFNNEVHGELVSESNFMWIPSLVRNNMHFSSQSTAGKVYTDENAVSLINSGKIFLPLFLIEGIINFVGYFAIGFGVRIGLKKLAINKNGTRKWYNYIPYFMSSKGACSGWYFIWYGATRAIIEPLRNSSYNMGNDNMWSVNSAYWMIGIGAFLLIVFFVWQVMRDHGKWILEVKEDYPSEKKA